ncbi:hypothetical protein [Rhodopirellula bahusiensis]|uniref:hypothetical protein n=1 Tax=Rhodopirellula bahusiensis TaxID=2014065 RepID=UPI00326595C3
MSDRETESAGDGSSDGQQALQSTSQDFESISPQRVVYEGALPIAFVSGLPDGTYRYRVEALDANGVLIASSDVPAIVQVSHWSVWQAMVLLVIGAIVFLAVIVVIVRGTLMHRPASSLTSSSPSDPALEEPSEGSRS